jgi:hypothetical protein
MKSLAFALCLAVVSNAAALPDQQDTEQRSAQLTEQQLLPQLADPPAPVAPWGVTDLISGAYQAYQYLSKVLADSVTEFKSGTSIGQVADHTIPKILPEAKLFHRVVLDAQKKVRADGKGAKALFGPFVLSGKNVSAQYIRSCASYQLSKIGLQANERAHFAGSSRTREILYAPQGKSMRQQRLHHHLRPSGPVLRGRQRSHPRNWSLHPPLALIQSVQTVH